MAEEESLENSFYEAITLILKPEKDITQKKKLQADITDEHRCKNPQQNTSKLNTQYIKWAIHHDQVRFISGMQGFLHIWKSINVIYDINKLMNKKHIITSIDAEKDFDKIQHLFIKNNNNTLQKVGIEGTYFCIIKAI